MTGSRSQGGAGLRGLVSAGMRRLGRRLEHRPPNSRRAIERLLAVFADAYEEPFFIEIGSNDGDQHDHLRPFIRGRGWPGLMVEPVPYVFERLRRNYGDLERVELADVAIGPVDGRLPFYHLAEVSPAEREQLPQWYDGIGSFSRETVLGHAHRIPDIENRLTVTEVPSLTFESLCRRYAVERLDLLLIDTEGYDWEVIKQIDLSAWAPALLIYEHFHLSAAESPERRGHLEAVGYEVMEEGFDTLCLHREAAKPVRSLWARLRPAVAPMTAEDR